MSQRSSVYDGVSDEVVTVRKGQVERLRDRYRQLTREECRQILAGVGWDLEAALNLVRSIKGAYKRPSGD